MGVRTSQASAARAGSEEEAMEVRDEEEREWVSVLGLRRRCGFGDGRRSGCSTEYGEAGSDAADTGGDCGDGDGSASPWRSMAAPARGRCCVLL